MLHRPLEPAQYTLYRLLNTRLPDSVMVSVTHRDSIRQHHDYHLHLVGDGGWNLERETESAGA